MNLIYIVDILFAVKHLITRKKCHYKCNFTKKMSSNFLPKFYDVHYAMLGGGDKETFFLFC